MPRVYNVKGAYERWLQNILTYVSQSITDVLCIVSSSESIFALKHQMTHLEPVFPLQISLPLMLMGD